MPCSLHVVRLARQEHVSAATRQIAQLELCFSSEGKLRESQEKWGTERRGHLRGRGSHILVISSRKLDKFIFPIQIIEYESQHRFWAYHSLRLMGTWFLDWWKSADLQGPKTCWIYELISCRKLKRRCRIPRRHRGFNICVSHGFQILYVHSLQSAFFACSGEFFTTLHKPIKSSSLSLD